MATGAEPMASTPLPPEVEAARQALLNPPRFQAGALLLLGTLALFIFSTAGEDSTIESVVLLILVLLFHELGHWVGMKLFGYKDVKMFFIPFLGAAVSGRKNNVASWKEALVSLLGPIPGIFVGLALLITLQISVVPSTWMKEVGVLLVAINAFNLLPLSALDGGRFFQRVIFSRNLWFDIGFQVITGVLLGLVAIALSSWALGLFAYLAISGVPGRHRLLKVTRTLAPSFHDKALADPSELDEKAVLALHSAARPLVPENLQSHPQVVATKMEQLLDALRRPPKALPSALLLGLWTVGFIASFLGFGLVVLGSRAPDWQRHPFPSLGFEADYPHEPFASEKAFELENNTLPASIRWSHLEFLERYNVQVLENLGTENRDDLAASIATMLARELDAEIVSDDPIELEGHPGRAWIFERRGRRWQMHFFVRGNKAFIASTSAPIDRKDAANNADRFLSSFRWTETTTTHRR